jgi:hypothetical protein
MFLGEILFALCMALLFTLVFTLGFKRPGPWPAWWAFFLVIFLAAWAGGLWITPAGPVFVGIYWLPIILVALVFAILLAAVAPPQSRQPKVETISQVKQRESTAEKMFDVFFWALLTVLAIAIILGYFMSGQEVVVTSV